MKVKIGCYLDKKRREGKGAGVNGDQDEEKQREKDETERDETDDGKQLTEARKDAVKVMMVDPTQEEEQQWRFRWREGEEVVLGGLNRCSLALLMVEELATTQPQSKAKKRCCAVEKR